MKKKIICGYKKIICGFLKIFAGVFVFLLA